MFRKHTSRDSWTPSVRHAPQTLAPHTWNRHSPHTASYKHKCIPNPQTQMHSKSSLQSFSSIKPLRPPQPRSVHLPLNPSLEFLSHCLSFNKDSLASMCTPLPLITWLCALKKNITVSKWVPCPLHLSHPSLTIHPLQPQEVSPVCDRALTLTQSLMQQKQNLKEESTSQIYLSKPASGNCEEPIPDSSGKSPWLRMWPHDTTLNF